jgi:hypothetical protein
MRRYRAIPVSRDWPSFSMVRGITSLSDQIFQHRLRTGQQSKSAILENPRKRCSFHTCILWSLGDLRTIGRTKSTGYIEHTKRCTRRVLIIEDVDRHIASYLGARYDISPFFFANHLHNSFSNFEERPPLGSLTIPSIHCKGKSIHLHYRQVIDLGLARRESSKQTCTNSNLTRSVSLAPPISTRSLGWARSCCSIMKKSISQDQWLCMTILTRNVSLD